MGQVKENVDTPAGVAYGLAAYIWWGVIPPYVALMKAVPALEILAHRILLSTGLLLIYMQLTRRAGDLRACLRDTFRRRMLFASGMIVGLNWFIFILSVTTAHAKEGSLGYFISPLFNALMGYLIFREQLRLGQTIAIGLAVVGVLLLILQTGAVPWLAFGLALTWSIYSAVRRVTPVDGVLGLAVESIFLSPIAAGFLAIVAATNGLGVFAHGTPLALLVASTGFVMTVPMVLFGQAARKLRLTTLGFLQYISPTIQFILAITLMREPFHSHELPGYCLVWTALAIYIAATMHGLRNARNGAIGAALD